MINLRAGIRSLVNTPAFSLVAVLTLAVGIGANAALFSVYDRLVLNPISLPQPSSLIAVWSNNPQLNFNAPAVSWPRYAELARSTTSFASTGISAFDNFTLTGNGEQPDQLNGLRVSGAFFTTLGVRPALGRDFTAEDDVPNGPKVCLLSHELWATRFGQRASIVNEVIQLNGQSWQVIGVMPPSLSAPFQQVQVFAPRVFEIGGLSAAQVEAGAGYAQPIARLKKGVTLEQAQTELTSFSAAYRQQFGARLDANNLSVARDYVDSIVGNLKPTFYTLLGAVAFVLLIACANVASLFVGAHRAAQGDRRAAVSGPRGDIVAFSAESLIFSAAASLVGALLARAALSALQAALGAQVPPNTVFALDWKAWVFIETVALVSALLVGIVPALHAASPDLVETLKDAVRGSSSARGGRFRAALIIGEVALSVVLLVGSSLLLLSFVSLQRTPPGFDPAGVATAFVGIPTARYATPQQQEDFYVRVVEQLRAHTQVTHAAAASVCRSMDSGHARRTACSDVPVCRCRNGRSPA
jgi:predicted permease